jgi:cystathionine gamma-lyase
MERCVSNAMQIALWLEQHAHQVERISYPGLHSHPQHDIAKRQQHAFGAMITVWLRGDLQSSKRFLESVRLFTLAESLGDIESLIEHPAIMTHASIPSEQRRAIGISDTMVRLSIGLEDVEDLIADLRHALNAMKI